MSITPSKPEVRELARRRHEEIEWDGKEAKAEDKDGIRM